MFESQSDNFRQDLRDRLDYLWGIISASHNRFRIVALFFKHLDMRNLSYV